MGEKLGYSLSCIILTSINSSLGSFESVLGAVTVWLGLCKAAWSERSSVLNLGAFIASSRFANFSLPLNSLKKVSPAAGDHLMSTDITWAWQNPSLTFISLAVLNTIEDRETQVLRFQFMYPTVWLPLRLPLFRSLTPLAHFPSRICGIMLD